MNRQEWLQPNNTDMTYCKLVHDILRRWKIENNITEIYDVHHRDDTDECIAYNNAHYELWGFEIDESGNTHFEYGKYIVFLPHGEHSRHHQSNKPKSIAHREKMSISASRRRASDETKAKISESHLGTKNPFYGKRHTDEAKAKISATKLGTQMSDETRNKMSKSHTGVELSEMHRNKMAATAKYYSEMYHLYKQQGGTLPWNAFKKEFANNEISINK